MLKSLSVAAVLVSATAGHALTYTVTPGAPDPGFAVGQLSLVDFNTNVLPAGFTLTGGYGYRTGSTSEAAAPAGDTTQYLYVSSALSPNNATRTSPYALSSVSFYWGSIDTYNSVTVLGANGTSLGTFGGSLFPPANGDQGASTSNERVNFTAGPGEAITGLRFASTGVAFEVDSVAGSPLGGISGTGAVPEPATWAMMLVGLGAVGVGVRRRNRTMVAVAS